MPKKFDNTRFSRGWIIFSKDFLRVAHFTNFSTKKLNSKYKKLFSTKPLAVGNPLGKVAIL